MVMARFKHWWRSRSEPAPAQGGNRNRLTVREPNALLAPFDGELAAIKARAGVPPEHWQVLYQRVFENYAALIQHLPASESHHHAGAGGLLQHGIEVVRHTLDLKQGVTLPRGEAPEVQSRRQDLWTYACVTAALLHDLGKPVTDHRITLFEGSHERGHAWSPIHGPMPVGATYHIAFNPQRVYRHHERIPSLLVHHLIPATGLQWIAGDSDALHSWLAAIQGDLADAGAIGEIVGKADGLSVARNLSGSTNVQLPTAQAKPLVERLITGLRYLLDNGDLPINKRGAAAYLDSDTLWLVSKTTLDKLRTHLIEEGQPGIPSRNDRLMDELQQHDLLIPNEDRAIWLCQIAIGDWQQQLTCLRLDVSRIWADPDRRPASIEGQVEPRNAEPNENDSAPASSPASGTPETTATASPNATGSVQTSNQANQSDSSADGLPLPIDIPDESAANSETATAEQSDANDRPSTATAAASSEARPAKAEHKADGQVPSLDASEDAGKRFLAWLRHSIEHETVPINTAKARIHVLPEGLALVSPGIFRDFDSANWNHAQKRFQKLQVHQKTPKDENIWTCQASGNRKQAILKVILIPDAAATLGVELPGANPAISLLEP